MCLKSRVYAGFIATAVVLFGAIQVLSTGVQSQPLDTMNAQFAAPVLPTPTSMRSPTSLGLRADQKSHRKPLVSGPASVRSANRPVAPLHAQAAPDDAGLPAGVLHGRAAEPGMRNRVMAGTTLLLLPYIVALMRHIARQSWNMDASRCPGDAQWRMSGTSAEEEKERRVQLHREEEYMERMRDVRASRMRRAVDYQRGADGEELRRDVAIEQQEIQSSQRMAEQLLLLQELADKEALSVSVPSADVGASDLQALLAQERQEMQSRQRALEQMLEGFPDHEQSAPTPGAESPRLQAVRTTLMQEQQQMQSRQRALEQMLEDLPDKRQTPSTSATPADADTPGLQDLRSAVLQELQEMESRQCALEVMLQELPGDTRPPVTPADPDAPDMQPLLAAVMHELQEMESRQRAVEQLLQELPHTPQTPVPQADVGAPDMEVLRAAVMLEVQEMQSRQRAAEQLLQEFPCSARRPQSAAATSGPSIAEVPPRPDTDVDELRAKLEEERSKLTSRQHDIDLLMAAMRSKPEEVQVEEDGDIDVTSFVGGLLALIVAAALALLGASLRAFSLGLVKAKESDFQFPTFGELLGVPKKSEPSVAQDLEAEIQGAVVDEQEEEGEEEIVEEFTGKAVKEVVKEAVEAEIPEEAEVIEQTEEAPQRSKRDPSVVPVPSRDTPTSTSEKELSISAVSSPDTPISTSKSPLRNIWRACVCVEGIAALILLDVWLRSSLAPSAVLNLWVTLGGLYAMNWVAPSLCALVVRFFTPAVSFLMSWWGLTVVPTLVNLLPTLEALSSHDLLTAAGLVAARCVATLVLYGTAAKLFSSSSDSESERLVADQHEQQAGRKLPSVTALGIAALGLWPAVYGLLYQPAYAASCRVLVYILSMFLAFGSSMHLQQWLMKVPFLGVICQPMILTTAVTMAVIRLVGGCEGLRFSNSLDLFNADAAWLLTTLLSPTLLSFAFVVFKHRAYLQRRLLPLLGFSLLHSSIAIAAMAGLLKYVLVPKMLAFSLISHTALAPWAIVAANALSTGNASLAAGASVLAGVVSAVVGPVLLNLLNVKPPGARALVLASDGALVSPSKPNYKASREIDILVGVLVGTCTACLCSMTPVQAFLAQTLSATVA